MSSLTRLRSVNTSSGFLAFFRLFVFWVDCSVYTVFIHATLGLASVLLRSSRDARSHCTLLATLGLAAFFVATLGLAALCLLTNVFPFASHCHHSVFWSAWRYAIWCSVPRLLFGSIVSRIFDSWEAYNSIILCSFMFTSVELERDNSGIVLSLQCHWFLYQCPFLVLFDFSDWGQSRSLLVKYLMPW